MNLADRITVARNGEGMGIIRRVLHYLQFAWGIDTPPKEMQANLDARIVLIKCEQALYNEAAAILGLPPVTNEQLQAGGRRAEGRGKVNECCVHQSENVDLGAKNEWRETRQDRGTFAGEP